MVDEHGTPRTWRPKDNIPLLARQARREAAKVLALLVSLHAGAVTWSVLLVAAFLLLSAALLACCVLSVFQEIKLC